MISESVGLADVKICTLLGHASARHVRTRQQNASKQGSTGMKKTSSKIREEITRLQEQLKAAETREAERIGKIALRAGLGDIEIDEGELQAAFEEVADRFRAKASGASDRKGAKSRNATTAVTPDAAGASAGGAHEA